MFLTATSLFLLLNLPLGAAPETCSGLSPNAATSAALIKQIGNSRYLVKRTAVDLVLNKLIDVDGCARIVPFLVKGVPLGFKLFSIRPGSIYWMAGFRNRDVVQSVNGFELSTPDRGMQLYAALQSATELDVKLLRGPSVRHHFYVPE